MAQGRSSAMLVAVLLVVSLAPVTQAAQHIVGGSTGWRVPNATANHLLTWTATTSIAAGDTLLFNYDPAHHNVLEVTLTNYESCTLVAITKNTTGADIFTVPPGMSYYICGIPGHCSEGQKIAVNASGTAPTAAPGPSAAHANAVTTLQVLAAVCAAVVASVAL